MRRALVLCLSNPNRDPRPRRALEWLSSEFELTTAAFAPTEFVHSRFVDVSAHAKPALGGVVGFLSHAASLKLNSLLDRNEASEWTKGLRAARTELSGAAFDLVLCFDAELLPLANAVRGRAKLIFDAREYYPAQFEDRLIWRSCMRDFAWHLCRSYLSRCDAIFTVSEGLREGYRTTFGVDSEVLYSLPSYRELAPTPVDPSSIRLVYHGNANPSRATHLMVSFARALERRFLMDFVVLPPDSRYVARLRHDASGCERIRFLEPLAFEDIVPFLNRYDLGVFYVPPTNFNLKHCMPNKLFEFIQARLGVIVGPSPDMKRFVEATGVGLAGSEWNVNSLVRDVNALGVQDIERYKQRSHAVAADYSSLTSARQFRAAVERVMSAPGVSSSGG
ncbi:MAG: hypothetical protein AB7O21_02115 [Gammaproteobacteria bacterium]